MHSKLHFHNDAVRRKWLVVRRKWLVFQKPRHFDFSAMMGYLRLHQLHLTRKYPIIYYM